MEQQPKTPEDLMIAIIPSDLVQLATNLMKNSPAIATEAKNIALVRMCMESEAKVTELIRTLDEANKTIASQEEALEQYRAQTRDEVDSPNGKSEEEVSASV